jgi:hypothetical protein
MFFFNSTLRLIIKILKTSLSFILLLVFLIACKPVEHIADQTDIPNGQILPIDKTGTTKPVEHTPDRTDIPSGAIRSSYLPFITNPVEFFPDWAIVPWGPFKLIDPPEITNPVLTAEDVTDRDAAYVADPFLFHENGLWYMLLEVYDLPAQKGEIGVASSSDGFHWKYERIVLDETFHLSYPYVFKVGSTYYMIPETFQLSEVRIYKAINFPYEWTYLTTIITGRQFVDPSVIYYEGRYWLFVSEPENKTLYLYSSDLLTENWVEHPQSPVIQDNTHQGRPGGRSFIYNGDQIIRISQNWGGGLKVRAFKVDILNTSQYAEHELPESPLLESGPEPKDWYAGGIHHLDPWWTGDYWLVAFDGRALDHSFRIGIKIAEGP